MLGLRPEDASGQLFINLIALSDRQNALRMGASWGVLWGPPQRRKAPLSALPFLLADDQLRLWLQIDKDGANPERVKQELSEAGLLPEEWGGKTPMIPVCTRHPPHSCT